MTVATPKTAPGAPRYFAAFTRRNDVRDQRHRREHQPAGADALHGAPGDQPADGVRETAPGGRNDEQRRAQLEDALAPPNRSLNLPASAVAIVFAGR
jgi:hypothetical protein